jgi:hypothetical protein
MAAKPLEPARKNKGATSSRHDERMMAAKKKYDDGYEFWRLSEIMSVML